jgi:SAM-dependent methyltransferase
MSTSQDQSAQAHWQAVYQRKPADSVSWYRPHLDTSLMLLRRAGLSSDSRVIDVGAGASTLVDDLLALGVAHVTVLDLSAQALALARARVGDRGDQVAWIPGDLLTTPLSLAGYDLWHDRAVLHFLTDAGDALRYAQQAARALRPGGHAVIGGFAPDGPERCSGLTVARRSPEEVAALLGPEFRLIDQFRERHVTPGGAEQAFVWSVLRREAGQGPSP